MSGEHTENYDEAGNTLLPSGLNALTILTFIGCGIAGLFTLFTPVINKFVLEYMDKATRSGQDIPAKKLEEIQKSREAIELVNQNLVPIMAISLAGVILCLIGALWMRKFKKDGYWMYVAGELAPLLGSFLILGTAPYSSVGKIIIGVGIPVIFVILYTMQRKYLTK
jgi:hypothetical protein